MVDDGGMTDYQIAWFRLKSLMTEVLSGYSVDGEEVAHIMDILTREI